MKDIGYRHMVRCMKQREMQQISTTDPKFFTKHSSFSPWNRPYYSPCNDIIFSLLPSVVGYICVKVSSVQVVALIPALHDICRQNAESHIHHYELLLCSIIVPNTVPIAIHTSRSTLAYIIVLQHTTSS